MYTVTLTSDQFYREMFFFTSRGYFPVSLIRNSEAEELDNDTVVLTIPEHVAWDLLDWDERDEDWFTGMSSELIQVWQDLLDEIV